MPLSDIDQNAVNFVPNFDKSQKEPSLLLARILNLLLNGAPGIAVCMASNTPPHNLGELVDAMSSYIHNPEVTNCHGKLDKVYGVLNWTDSSDCADIEISSYQVNFVPNFDKSQKEPSLLPARILNLLLNGAPGIAVCMASNTPPHNLGELVDAMSSYIHNPEVTVNFVPNFYKSQKEPSLLPARILNLLLNGAPGIAVCMASNTPPHNLGELVDAMSSYIHNPKLTNCHGKLDKVYGVLNWTDSSDCADLEIPSYQVC
ncbi:unnamed protein product [Cuscuta campestris]|uniref:Topo IIA-type catalytic domain-containing protein n=1 Tax=Cuscuta campestris TaxID=132261 RepID=A0A484NAR2_9ASTE|nr:unnamed protein product [Cuscuta campestris]